MEMTYADWLKAQLEERELLRYGNHQIVARLFRVNVATVYRWLNGKRVPRGNQMLYIAAALAGRDGELVAQLLLEQVCIQTLGTRDYQSLLADA